MTTQKFKIGDEVQRIDNSRQYKVIDFDEFRGYTLVSIENELNQKKASEFEMLNCFSLLNSGTKIESVIDAEELKNSLRKLLDYIISVNEIFNWPHITTMEVLIHNLIAEKNLTEDICNKTSEVINKLSLYRSDCHITAFVASNLSMDIIGFFNSHETSNI